MSFYFAALTYIIEIIETYTVIIEGDLLSIVTTKF